MDEVCNFLDRRIGKLNGIVFSGGECTANPLFLKLAKEGKLANVKWLLIYQSSNFKDGKNLSLDLNLKPLFSGNFGDDSYTWYEILD